MNQNTDALAQPPTAVATVDPASALGEVKLSDTDRAALGQKVDAYSSQLLSLDVHGDDFRKQLDGLANLANSDIAASASVSNRLLDKPMRAMQQGGFSEGTAVGKDLLQLRNTIEDLDPSNKDLFSPKRLLGFIPAGNRLLDYFRGYESSQTQLNAIVNSLFRGKDTLARDNAAIDEEKTNLWSLMQRLEKYGYIAQKLDASLEQKIATIETTDPARAKILKEEALFTLRQKRQDIATQQAVNLQGYLTLDLVRRNNVALISGVDRATTTTLAALRTAVMAAQALTDQKLVLDQITALNDTTNRMILNTSQMLKDNSVRIAEQASNPSVQLETLQKSFDNIFQTLDTIDDYKIKALDAMKQTIDGLQTQIERAKPYLDKERERALQGAAQTSPAPLTVD